MHENVALTGVLSSLCLAATAAEVSPVRRLLLVLLFDGTQDAPFRRLVGDSRLECGHMCGNDQSPSGLDSCVTDHGRLGCLVRFGCMPPAW